VIRHRAFSLKHLARLLGVSQHTVERQVARGQIKSIKVSERRRIVPDDEVKRLLAGAVPKVTSSNG
jgi:excisionase family DNA binding protein